MAFNSMGSLFYLLCQWLLTVVVVPLCSFEAAGILTLSISLTNVFFTLATFGIRIFQVSDSQGKYGPGLYISTRVLTCLCSFALCAVFLLCNRQYTAEQVLCILFYMLYRIGEALVDVLAGEEQKAYRFDYVGLSFLFRGLTTLLSFSLVLYCTRNLTLTLLVMAVMTLGVVLAYDGRKVKALTGFRLHLSFRESLPLLREAWPLMLNSALLTLLAALPRYFLEMYHGSELLGYFGSVSTPAVIIQAGCSFIYTPLVGICGISGGCCCWRWAACWGLPRACLRARRCWGAGGWRCCLGRRSFPMPFCCCPCWAPRCAFPSYTSLKCL